VTINEQIGEIKRNLETPEVDGVSLKWQAAADDAERNLAGLSYPSWVGFVDFDALRVFSSHNSGELRSRLLILAARSIAWIEAIDRRTTEPANTGETIAFWPPIYGAAGPYA